RVLVTPDAGGNCGLVGGHHLLDVLGREGPREVLAWSRWDPHRLHTMPLGLLPDGIIREAQLARELPVEIIVLARLGSGWRCWLCLRHRLRSASRHGLP